MSALNLAGSQTSLHNFRALSGLSFPDLTDSLPALDGNLEVPMTSRHKSTKAPRTSHLWNVGGPGVNQGSELAHFAVDLVNITNDTGVD